MLEKLQRDPQVFSRYYDVVVDAIESLQPLQRMVIESLYWERLSERKIAQRADISRSSVRWHKKQALKCLEEALKEALDDKDRD